MLVWIGMERKIWRQPCGMRVHIVEDQILVGKEMLATVCTLNKIWGNSVCCFCVTIQSMIWWKSFITLVTLEGFHLSFHCKKWQRGVGDNWWALDWIWRGGLLKFLRIDVIKICVIKIWRKIEVHIYDRVERNTWNVHITEVANITRLSEQCCPNKE